MGLILDTSVLIAGERRGMLLSEVLGVIRLSFPAADIAISTITLVEFDHGLYRARSDQDIARRKVFADDVAAGLLSYPVDSEVAHLAGRIEGQQAANGIAIALADLLIGATALYLGDSILTHNTKHFNLIPNLTVLTL